MTAPARYYRAPEIASRLGISVRTVRRRIESGEWRSRLEGRCRLVLAEDVDALPGGNEPQRNRVSREARSMAKDLGL